MQVVCRIPTEKHCYIGITLAPCYGLNICVSHQIHVEVLTPNGIVFGDGSLWEVIRFRRDLIGGPHVRISALIGKVRKTSTLSFLIM